MRVDKQSALTFIKRRNTISETLPEFKQTSLANWDSMQQDANAAYNSVLEI